MKPEKKQGLPKAFLMALMKVFHYTTSVMAFIAVWWFMYSGHGLENYQPNADYLVYFVYCISLYCLFRIYDVYNIGYARTTDNVFGQVLSDVISAGIIYVMMSILSGAILNPLALLGLGVFQGIWNIAWSKLTKEVYYKFYKRKRTVVVYRNRDDLQRVEEMRYLTRKFKIEKLVHNTHDDFRSLEPELEGFDAIIVAGVEASLRNGIAKYCIEKNVRGYFAPHVGDIIMQGAHHISSFRVPIMSVRRAFKNPFYLILKRVFDIVISILAIVILSPVYLITALAIKLYDRGPVLYKQVRLTRDGKQFKVLKFRSMKVDAEKDGVARLAAENDSRITPVGKFIRSCRLDELPQCFNILAGDMSIVGPRPERPEIAEQYEEEMPAFSLRLQVKAGLTGFAQVYGKYNTTPYDKLQMDLMYVNKMSVTEDLRLIFATMRAIFMPESTEGIDKSATTAMKVSGKSTAEGNEVQL